MTGRELQRGVLLGELELRAGGRRGKRLRGKFPYSRRAVISDGGRNGRPQKEVFAPRAFGFRVEDPAADIHLLLGHSYDRPLASKGSGSLVLHDSDDALTFEALIAPEVMETNYWVDFWGGFLAGLVIGISPGFRIPPAAAVPPEQAERVEEEDPSEGRALIRTILQAALFELSLVTVPAYKETEVEARQLIKPAAPKLLMPAPASALRRWRP